MIRLNLWIISHLERIPAPGETFVIEGLAVRIERASRRRIHEVRISRSSVAEPGLRVESAAGQPAIAKTASPE
jgi:Mg2+/Co2+ transporter CorC